MEAKEFEADLGAATSGLAVGQPGESSEARGLIGLGKENGQNTKRRVRQQRSAAPNHLPKETRLAM
jgi:hypothetical protein